MPMCPLAEACKGFMEKPTAGFSLIAVWLVAAAFILFGITLLFVSSFVRKIGTQIEAGGRGAAGG
jgi:hypothetical protein